MHSFINWGILKNYSYLEKIKQDACRTDSFEGN